MIDMEMTQATAAAMGFKILYDRSLAGTPYLDVEDSKGRRRSMLWSPLNSDEQCWLLLDSLGLHVFPPSGKRKEWTVRREAENGNTLAQAKNSDLRRAIVECVASLPPAAADEVKP